jgi:RimJ/RimL family protein N-acetyltransferase
MNHKDTVNHEISPGLRLRSATALDIENLRAWKNAQSQFFFHQAEISPTQQRAWFDAFVQRPNDYMLMVEHQGTAKGCMGIRLLEAQWDIYNVILGDPAFGGQGHMGRAFAAMLAMALQQCDLPITLKVLKHNPAVRWYLKNGFTTAFEAEDHFGLRYQAPNA